LLSGAPHVGVAGADRGRLRGVLVLVLEHHADGPLAQLLRVSPLSGHGSNLSRAGASRNPGAVQVLPPAGHGYGTWVVVFPLVRCCVVGLPGLEPGTSSLSGFC